MFNYKLGSYAVLLELGAWSGGLLLRGHSDAVLVWYLLVHAAASGVLALAALVLLPAAMARPRLAVWLLLAACIYALPIVGFVVVIAAVLHLRWFRSRRLPQPFESLQLPVFDPHQRIQAGFGQVGVRALLGNTDAPLSARISSMIALQHIPGRVAAPLLRSVLSDPSEDIRLLAYGLLDSQEKRINQLIDDELKILHQAQKEEGLETPGPRTLESAQWLSDFYWELIYQGLVQGDLRAHALGESTRYAQQVLDGQPQHPALTLRRAQLLQAQGQLEAAEQAYQHARELGLPATRVLPYLAELHFERGDFAGTQRLMAELAQWGALPRLRPVIDYWNPP